MRRFGLAIGGVIVLAAAAAIFTLGGAAGRRARPSAAAPPAADIAARAVGPTQLTPVPWINVPAAVIAWSAAHAAAPAAGMVAAGGTRWAVLTSGPQPSAIRLFPLLLAQPPAGTAYIEVALAPGAEVPGGAHATLAVALPPTARYAAFRLHVLGGAQGITLGQVAHGSCAAVQDGIAAAKACAAALGLRGATWSASGGEAQAVLGGQAFRITVRPVGLGVAPAAVTWEGPAHRRRVAVAG